LTRVTQRAARHAQWHEWLRAHLPIDLADKLSAVVERDGTLVLLAQSAVWSTRLRYAIQDIEEELRRTYPTITRISVRVSPKGATD
jgi:hypothetical protein